MRISYRLIATVLTVLTMLLAWTPSALAQSSILYVSPNRVTVAPNEKMASLNVSNQSDVERRYDITMVEQVMTNEGMTQRLEEFDYSASRMLRFVPKRFTLKPGERQTIRVMAKRPSDLADGDYHSHLLFREIPVANKSKEDIEAERTKDSKKVSFDIRAIYGVAVPIIIQQGTISSDLNIEGASYIPASDGAPAHLAIQLRRSGNAEASGRLLAIYKPSSGEEVTLVDNQWVPVYREVDVVTKRYPLDKLSGGMRGGTLSLTLTKPTGEVDGDGKPKTVSETKEISF